MTEQPNIFKFATSELSQDAMLAYIAAWADPALKNRNPELHTMGRKFIQMMVGEAFELGDETIKVETQKWNIDVLITIGNSEKAIILEDKTHTNLHSNQQEKYRNTLKEKGYSDTNIYNAYFKLVDEFDPAKKSEGSRFVNIGRSHLINLLRDYIELDELLKQFYIHLCKVESEHASFRTTFVSQWEVNGPQWKAFFKTIENEFPNSVAGWQYVANAAGGMWVLWFKSVQATSDGSVVYAQIESKLSAFKLRVWVGDSEKRDKSELRNYFTSKIHAILVQPHVSLRKPTRVNIGKTMAFAQVFVNDSEKWISTSEDGLIDMDSTIKTIKSVLDVLHQFEV